MPWILGIAIQVGVLWFLINYFTGETDPDAGLRKTLFVVAIVVAANLVLTFAVRPMIGGFSSLISLIVLYSAVGWVCETTRRESLWITGGYLVALGLIELVIGLLVTPV